jgi:hypothetical protein
VVLGPAPLVLSVTFSSSWSSGAAEASSRQGDRLGHVAGGTTVEHDIAQVAKTSAINARDMVIVER